MSAPQIQILQNKAARVVTGKTWWTPVRTLLQDCKWLSINQLVFFHTALQTHEIIRSGFPVYLRQNMSTVHPYRNTERDRPQMVAFGLEKKTSLVQVSAPGVHRPTTLSQLASKIVEQWKHSSTNFGNGWQLIFPLTRLEKLIPIDCPFSLLSASMYCTLLC